MELSYQNGQKLVEESLLAWGDEIRMRIRSFLVAEKQSSLAQWLVFFLLDIFFFPSSLWLIFSNACYYKDSMKNDLVNIACYFCSWSLDETCTGTASAGIV